MTPADPAIPDVTDPDIRAMVLRNHEPEESWIGNFATGDRQVFVYCAACWQAWPCPVRDAAWKAEQQAVRDSIVRIVRIEREKRPRRRWWRR